MGSSLDDYRELHADLGPRAAEVLRASWQEATRSLSPKGLEDYLRSARALHALGRGSDPVASFIQEAPVVAREIGEDAVAQLASAALAMASRTSGAVIGLVIATSSTAARRLADPELFGAWLAFLDQLLAQAPRGVRPMLERLDRLLGELTLGGLRRWALWGAQAHRSDFAAQDRYFALESPDSVAILQRERKGTLFVDVQRRLAMYLRALWGRDFPMRPTSGDYEGREGRRPFIADGIIHLPDALDDLALPGGGGSGLEQYRAMAAHAAAHLVHTREALPAGGLTPLERAAVGVMEDARIEALAARDFPGLAALWRRFYTASAERESGAWDWLDRVARAIADPAHEDGHPLVSGARQRWAEGGGNSASNRPSLDMGLRLARDLSGLHPAPRLRGNGGGTTYRDDNRYTWEFDEAFALAGKTTGIERQVRRRVSLMEFVNATDVETAGDDAQEIWTLSTELFPYEDEGLSYNAKEGKAPVAEPVHYPEWDYQIGMERPDWCTVLDKPAPLGDPSAIDAIIAARKPLVARLRRLIEAMQPQGVLRLRKQEEGDDIDLEAAVRAIVDMRTGTSPDTRVHRRDIRRIRDLAVLVLLDLSQSTNERIPGSEATVLDLTREAAALLADAMAKLDDPFAIHGFASDGRHEVQYRRFKDFAEPWGAVCRARLAGMQGRLSTRMGTAMRHAGALLARRPEKRKLVIVLTDGAPSDVDVRDPQYLRADARHAVEGLSRAGVDAYCISLDPRADDYVARIFGPNRHAVVDRAERLPERLPLLYLSLTR